jgi:transposase-like protein
VDVGRSGKTTDFSLRAKRGVAAKAFIRKATKHQKQPSKTIALDGNVASRRAAWRRSAAAESLPILKSGHRRI